MSTDPPIALSPATPEDHAFLLALRNHPTIAEQSFSGPVDPAGHSEWFTRQVNNPLIALLIATERGVAVGMGRLDAQGTWNGGDWHYEVEISVAVCPEVHGRGLGTEIIRGLAREAGVKWPGCLLTARIKEGNHGSRTAFSRAGFVIEEISSEGVVTMTHNCQPGR